MITMIGTESTQQMLVHEKDAETEETLSKRSGLSISQVSSLLKTYLVVPKSRICAFDSRAMLSVQAALENARQENYRLRAQIIEMSREIERLKKNA